MKWRVHCGNCGADYKTELEFKPKFCASCGCDTPNVSKSGRDGRATAEKMMAELDGIKPRLMAAYEAWFAVRAEYEDIWQKLCVYHKRGLLTDEEFERYRTTGMRSNDINAAVSERRKQRRENKG